MKNSADYPIRTVPQLAIPMPDGVRLGGRLYMPAAPNDGPFPAIVEAHPYRKDDNKVARDWRTHSYLARKGYVGVRIDTRGSGASEGVATMSTPARNSSTACTRAYPVLSARSDHPQRVCRLVAGRAAECGRAAP